MRRLYNIANLTVEVTGEVDDIFPVRMQEYEEESACFAAEEKAGLTPENKPDVSVHFRSNCRGIELPAGKNTVHMIPRSWMELTDGGYALFDILPSVTDEILMLTVANHNFSNFDVQLCDPEILSLPEDHRHYPLMGELMKYAVLFHDGMMLHSSAIRYKGDALLFSAPSGTGKSTHTGLWQKVYPNDVCMINDDMPIIRFNQGQPVAYGAPWSGKSRIHNNISAPLKAVVFLEQAANNQIRRITGAEAAFRTMNETKKMFSPELTQRMLGQIEKLLYSTPTYLLSCNISEEAVEVVRQELYS